MNPEEQKYFLRVEAVNLGNFVYDTQDLSTVRGGGLLLLEAVSHVQKELEDLSEPSSVVAISTGASSGLFEFVPKTGTTGEDVRKNIDKNLKEPVSVYHHATFVVDVIEAGADTEFTIKKEELLARNRWRQMQSPSLAIPVKVSEVTLPCTVDLVRPQSKDKSHVSKEMKRVSVSVHQRRQFGIDSKLGEFYRGLPVFLKNTAVAMSKEAEVTAAWLLKTEHRITFTEHLDQLSSNKDFKNLHNKIAVIYADGNSFGKLQQEFDKEAQKTQMEFDKKLKAYRSAFMMELLARMQHDDSWKNNDKLRIETLLWGGDEFMLVVPAWQGWETLRLFFENSAAWNFTYINSAGKEITQNLTHSVGMVFCHHNAPIHQVKTLAHDLAEIAKSVGKDEFYPPDQEWAERFPFWFCDADGCGKVTDSPTQPELCPVCGTGKLSHHKGNYFAFQVMESFDAIHGDPAEYRQSICPKTTHHGALLIAGADMGKISDAMAVIKTDEKVSRGRIHGLVKSLVADNTVEAKKHCDKLLDACEAITTTALNDLEIFFHGDKARWLQIAELWDYVAASRGE